MTAHDETPDAPHPGGRPAGLPPDADDSGPEAAVAKPAAEPRGDEAAADRRNRGFSAWVLGGGTEPDARFTLANERTFLAWIRTSLALVAGGIAVEAFTSELFTPEVRKTVSVLLLLLGMVTGGGSFFRWVNVERAMRNQASLPVPVIAPILAAGGALVAAVLVVFVIWRPA